MTPEIDICSIENEDTVGEDIKASQNQSEHVRSNGQILKSLSSLRTGGDLKEWAGSH